MFYGFCAHTNTDRPAPQLRIASYASASENGKGRHSPIHLLTEVNVRYETESFNQ